jgi:hypothetical protein
MSKAKILEVWEKQEFYLSPSSASVGANLIDETMGGWFDGEEVKKANEMGLKKLLQSYGKVKSSQDFYTEWWEGHCVDGARVRRDYEIQDGATITQLVVFLG